MKTEGVARGLGSTQGLKTGHVSLLCQERAPQLIGSILPEELAHTDTAFAD
jgi:hypothetical protein